MTDVAPSVNLALSAVLNPRAFQPHAALERFAKESFEFDDYLKFGVSLGDCSHPHCLVCSFSRDNEFVSNMSKVDPSDTTHLRSFHNWIKQELYGTYLQPNQRLVELGCGRGGDLFKIQHCRPRHVINIDISKSNIEEAQRRCADGHIAYSICWHVADLTTTDSYASMVSQKILNAPESIDVFSSQFSMTHFWKSHASFCNLMDWVSTFLKRGGYFIGTMPDGAQIQQLCASASASDNGKCFESNILRIRLSDTYRYNPTKHDAKEGQLDAKEENAFGRGVQFSMANSIIQDSTDEFLVDWSAFLGIAEHFRFKLVSTALFEQWYQKYHKSNLASQEMQASFLNRSFVFQKY